MDALERRCRPNSSARRRSGSIFAAFIVTALHVPAALADATPPEPEAQPGPLAVAPVAPIPRAAIAEELEGYYRGERTTAIVFVTLGALSAGTGAILVTRDADFARGLGWSMIGIGGLEAIGATFYAFQVGAQLDHYATTLAADPAAFKREEAVHIHGTTSRFVLYRTSELVLAALGVGAATYGFATNHDVWKGAGIGVAGEALTFFVLDSFGTSRAHAYEDHVRRFEPTVAFKVGGGERPWSLDLSGRF